MRERRLAPATLKRRVACLKSVFGWLEDEGQANGNPFHRLKLVIRLPRQLPRDLKKPELKLLLLQASKEARSEKSVTSLTLWVAVELMFSTGIRVGELCRIILSDGPTWWGTVTDVVDGDTIFVRLFNIGVEFDLYQIDAPELDQPYGREAAVQLRALIKGRRVRIAPRGKDKNGRLRAMVYSEHGLSLNDHLIESGHARWDRESSPECGACEHAEKKARKAKMGLWGIE